MSRIRTKTQEDDKTDSQPDQKPLRVRHGGAGDDRWYTKLVHPVLRWRLGARYAGMKDTYVTMASWTLEGSDLLNSGRLSLTDLSKLLDLSLLHNVTCLFWSPLGGATPSRLSLILLQKTLGIL